MTRIRKAGLTASALLVLSGAPIALAGDFTEDFFSALDALGINDIYEDGALGASSMLLTIEGQRPLVTHEVFTGKTPVIIDWQGINPVVTSASAHATGVLGAAAGAPTAAFHGVAPEVPIASAPIARQLLLGETFLVSRQALAHALFHTTSEEGAAALGLPRPVTVINSSWGTFGDFVGEGVFAQLYDAAATMRENVVLVHAVGNGGTADGQCDGTTAGSGAEFIGQRTVTSPASSYNGIAVGSSGIDTFDIEDDPDDDGDSLLDFFANLGIPLAPGPDLSFGLPILLDPTSSRGPVNSFNHETGEIVEATRSGVDLVAPGTGFIQYFSPVFIGDTCDWTGHIIATELLLPSINPDDPADNMFYEGFSGSSYASAVVAGAVALLQDLAAVQDPPISTDPILIKSILQNSATRMFGWTNGGDQIGEPQDVRDGGGGSSSFVTDRSPFDYAQGAGLLNFTNARVQYLFGIQDVAATDPDVPMITRDIAPFEPGFTPDTEQTFVTRKPGRQRDTGSVRTIDEINANLDKAAQAAGPQLVGINHRRPDMGDGPIRRPPLSGGGTGDGAPFVPFRPLPGTPPGGGPIGPNPGGPGPGVGPQDVEEIQNRLFVGRLGWDIGMLGQIEIEDPDDPDGEPIQQGFIDYVIGPVFAQETVRLTLNWNKTVRLSDEPDFSDPANQTLPGLEALELENLDMAVFLALDDTGALAPEPETSSLLGISASQLNNSEHLTVALNPSGGEDFQGFLIVRVAYSGTDYDLMNNLPDAETRYALTWNIEQGFFETPVDDDMEANIGDLNAVIIRFNSAWGDANYDRTVDFNRDHKINTDDLNFVIAHWGG